ncbi:hydantoinase/oxoprolinase family protein [Haladaptatus sp. DJG-WS-42]|uniref:hydantoinase/oxoprolinase family protein n=1 Tax=Haladaptatus sp. DJG-WS-42 TaxID=3120516 RepID=UPI0030D4A71E
MPEDTRIGVDIGGTFTDFISIDEQTGTVRVVKTPSVPETPERSVGNALRESGVKEASRLSHGTTVVTNAILERAGAETALITTARFADILELDRQDRDDIYDLSYKRKQPLVPRYRCFGVEERIGPDGEVVTELDESAVTEIAAVLSAANIESVAVSFLHSYVNDEHERRAKELLDAELDIPVTTSSEVLPEFREYERTNTTVLNAYARPVAETYLDRLTSEIDAHSAVDEIVVMRSDGGVVPTTEAATLPVYLGVSGPAAGVTAATALAQQAGFSDIFTFDMGGTSADTSLVRNGTPEITKEGTIGEQAASIPMYDIRTIGAGGGSIAWVDDGGLLKVGPRSAGADPGPACYGHGGTEPTVTDANVVLGLINPDANFGGSIDLSKEAAEDALAPLAAKLDCSVLEAAQAVYDIVNMNMVESARVLSVQQGIDPREFSFVSFGGAGPLHAAAVARELGTERVVVPPRPGILSAVGLVYSDVRRTASKTNISRLADTPAATLEQQFTDLEAAARSGIGVPESATVTRHTDLRFAGQAHEISVETPAELTAEDLDALADRFRARHDERYGFVMESDIEVVTCRVAVTVPGEKPTIQWEIDDVADAGTRDVYLDGHHHTATVLERQTLPPGYETTGPAIVEMEDSTAVVLPDQTLRIDDHYNMILEDTDE